LAPGTAVDESRDKPGKKTIRVLTAASFLNDLGSDMIYPVWPMFVTGVLGANMAILGFIDGMGEALVSLSQAVSGYLSDRTGKRKVFIWTGYLCGSLSRFGYALSVIWQHLVPFKILDRAGKMRGAPRDAIIADISSDEDRGRNFGLLRSMDNLGAVCGIVLCILLFERLGYRALFALAALPSAAAAVLVYTLIHDTRRVDQTIFKGFALRDTGPAFRRFLFLSALFSLGSFSYSFLLLIANESGVKPGFVPVLYLIFSIVASLTALPFGRLSDKIGRKRVLALSFVLWGSVSLTLLLTRSYPAIITCFVLYGLHRGSLEPVQKTFVAELAPRNYRASALGGFQMVVGLCALPASLAAGILWDILGPEAPLGVSLTLTIISILILPGVKNPRA
jgi:MFS family permease